MTGCLNIFVGVIIAWRYIYFLNKESFSFEVFLDDKICLGFASLYGEGVDVGGTELVTGYWVYGIHSLFYGLLYIMEIFLKKKKSTTKASRGQCICLW